MAFSAAATTHVSFGWRALVASTNALFRPLRVRTGARLVVRASLSGGERAVIWATAAAAVAMLALPDIAVAAQPGLSPSLKNFLLSIVAGGVVLAAIIGAVVAVSNFDPVKRS